MSRLFQRKLEFTLIIAMLVLLTFTAISQLNAQNINSINKVKELSQLIDQISSYKDHIPEQSLESSKNLLSQLQNNSFSNPNKELIDQLTDAHIDFLNALILEAEHKIELARLNNTILEQQQLYDKLSKYNTEISEDLENY